jgi:hypothetical protein
LVQQKAGRKIWVPFTLPLQQAIATWKRRPGFILLRPSGIPWTRQVLSLAWKYERRTNKNLVPFADATLHGLRATACIRLSRAGANTRQIAAMAGMSEPLVATYFRFSQQRDDAMAAVLHLDKILLRRKETNGER